MQILVTRQLPPEEALYLRCLTDRLEDKPLIDRLVNDYSNHLTQPVYEKYMNQLTNANLNPKGESPMAICCEGIFRLCGTSSKEIEERAWQAASAQQEEKYTAIIADQQNEIARLKALLAEKGLG